MSAQLFIDISQESGYVFPVHEIDVNQTILIVIGIDLKPEEIDRPIAYQLQKEIEASTKFNNHPFRKCIVISDSLYTQDKILQACPTIAIGGPGVNNVAAEFVEKLPVYLSKDNEYYIQLEKDFKNQKISIWGMDRKTTKEAVETFVANEILSDFLKTIWK